MKAQVLVNGEVPEEKITVVNGLRQGCMMASTLFNLYGCIVAEHSLARQPLLCRKRERGSGEPCTSGAHLRNV